MRPIACLPLIDWGFLDLQTFGDKALAAELLGLFAEQCARLLPVILDEERPVIERADLAHQLKGSALGIGAASVAHCASEVEGALRSGDPSLAPLIPLSDIVAETLAMSSRPI